LKTLAREIGIPMIQYPVMVIVDARPYLPRPLMIPVPTPCKQSKKMKMFKTGMARAIV
jgi:hypothetical protein